MDGPGIWEEQSESGGDGKRAILTGSPGKADEGSEGLCAGLILGAVRHLPRNHARPQHAFGSIIRWLDESRGKKTHQMPSSSYLPSPLRSFWLSPSFRLRFRRWCVTRFLILSAFSANTGFGKRWRARHYSILSRNNVLPFNPNSRARPCLASTTSLMLRRMCAKHFGVVALPPVSDHHSGVGASESPPSPSSFRCRGRI